MQHSTPIINDDVSMTFQNCQFLQKTDLLSRIIYFSCMPTVPVELLMLCSLMFEFGVK